MDIRIEIDRIERRLAKISKTPKDLCEAAHVSPSQWSRWKNTGQRPLLETWLRVQAAAERIAT
jgi:hypothetical protein